ncbi:hypothetical protein IW261DRAFT_1563199 [Armillaria novae-zelandiae]|uniref:Uncharacterized protein n=1 Tax=Armillaria novae-zelandiae TaxID=153914 RepID=A0AA39PD78_9AGAR|nr:hypothetical protein IW261DRAFT_1563195 [Armillaria novae-zelandiae]KAK0481924.1 hypothetical protein IW261DRAFT_1563197 [Armillaria novae-zelandiae]KAK0481929.1 hypothetical protein IW261DRAFT_1563199 [Armillaria novae-zelandiae]
MEMYGLNSIVWLGESRVESDVHLTAYNWAVPKAYVGHKSSPNTTGGGCGSVRAEREWGASYAHPILRVRRQLHPRRLFPHGETSTTTAEDNARDYAILTVAKEIASTPGPPPNISVISSVDICSIHFEGALQWDRTRRPDHISPKNCFVKMSFNSLNIMYRVADFLKRFAGSLDGGVRVEEHGLRNQESKVM